MKNLLVALSVALLAAGSAFGAGSAQVLGPAAVDPGQTFEIEVFLTADQPMVSFVFDSIEATGGAKPGPANGGTQALQAAYHYGNTVGWDNALASCDMAWGSKAAFPVGTIGTSAVDVFTGVGPGVAFRMSIIAPDAPDSFFDVFVTSGIYGNLDFEDVDLSQSAVAPLRVYVTPEPVSALLLLAGLPMLRRRR